MATSSETENIHLEQPDEVDADFEDSQTDILGDYPIDSLLIRQESRSVYEVVRRIEKGSYVMNPDFQRDFVWSPAKQSKLIESCLMRIPLPAYYLAELINGKTVVVDGLQRLTTFKRFLSDELVLSGLSDQNSLNGKKFSQLLPKLQNRIEDTNLIIYLIDHKVPDKAKLDIFDRVNSGVALTKQQMRNALYGGQATRLLRDLAQSDLFLRATGGSFDRKKMRDREAINRFCGFYIFGAESYSGDMHDFLEKTLKEMNDYRKEDLEILQNNFLQSMRNNTTLFGIHAFRKGNKGQTRRTVINVALFDILSVYFAKVPESLVIAKKDKLLSAFFTLIQNDLFSSSITLGTNQRNKVQLRFNMAELAFNEALN